MSNNPGNERLREVAVRTQLSSRSLEEAARKVDKFAKTLSRWLEDPEFNSAYQEAKRTLLRTGIGSLTTKVTLAVDALAEVARQKGRP